MHRPGLSVLVLLLLSLPLQDAAAAKAVRTEFDRTKLDVRRKVRNKEARVREDLAEEPADAEPTEQQSRHSHTTIHRRSIIAGDGASAVTSSLAPWTAPYTGTAIEARDFYDFSNVMLKNDSLIFFGDEGMTEPLPPTLRLSRYEQQLDLPVLVYTAANRSQAPVCKQWADRPGLLFSGTTWDTNINEFFVTTLMPLFQTASMTGLLTPEHMQSLMGVEASKAGGNFDAARMELLSILTSKARNGAFSLISGRPTFFGSRWSYHIKYLTADQSVLSDMQGLCFKRLVVSEDAALRFLYERVHEMQDAGYVAYRSQWMAQYQAHIFAAEKLEAMVQEVFSWDLAPTTKGRSPSGKPLVTFVSRSLANRRAIINEAELRQAVSDAWDVQVVNTSFHMPLRDAISLMVETDVLIGMHGAGLTNAFWMRPGTVMMQLLPYGWQLPTGQLIRTGLSRDMSLALNGTYLQWVNPARENAFFQEYTWNLTLGAWKPQWGPKPDTYTPQPPASMDPPKDWDPPGFWVYQDTRVDLGSIAPVLQQAMEAVGAKRRAQVS